MSLGNCHDICHDIYDMIRFKFHYIYDTEVKLCKERQKVQFGERRGKVRMAMQQRTLSVVRGNKLPKTRKC